MKAVKHSFQTKVLVPNFLISPIWLVGRLYGESIL
jgi:hypothetical protein